MRIIPVIDIRNGAVVRAIAGRRAEYRPLQSCLTAATTPIAVAYGFLAFYPFDTLYIADLDAIEGRGANREAIRAIGEAFPSLELWVDAGVRSHQDLSRWRDQNNLRLVLGSESLSSAGLLRALKDRDDCVLSLDFQDTQFLGDPEILKTAALWPARLIVMTLSRVGGDAGPDVSLLADMIARAGNREVYGAGGVRHAGDMERLAKTGATGVLVSSALHNGGVCALDLETFMTRRRIKKGSPQAPPEKPQARRISWRRKDVWR